MKNAIKIITAFVLIVGIVIALASYAILTPSVSAIDRFNSIPPKPDDFDAYTREIWSGHLSDLCTLEDKYWKQPEFYGNSWKIAQDKFYNNPDYSKWGVYGDGNIPQSIGYTLENLKVGDEFTMCSFFHNGFGIWTYQGFKLDMAGNEYFDIKITPNQLTMSPTFPVFEDGWTQKIQITFKVKKEVPSGSYNFYLQANPPSENYSASETKRVLELTIDKTKYKEECIRFLKDENRCDDLVNQRDKSYVAGGNYQTDQPLLEVKLDIK